jgi:hypothetical protein
VYVQCLDAPDQALSGPGAAMRLYFALRVVNHEDADLSKNQDHEHAFTAQQSDRGFAGIARLADIERVPGRFLKSRSLLCLSIIPCNLLSIIHSDRRS